MPCQEICSNIYTSEYKLKRNDCVDMKMEVLYRYQALKARC